MHLRKTNPLYNWITIGYDVLRECLVSDFCSKQIKWSLEVWNPYPLGQGEFGLYDTGIIEETVLAVWHSPGIWGTE